MNDNQERKTGRSAAQSGVVVLVVALTAGALIYRLLKHERLGNSSAMFLGIPAVLAILLALTPKAKSVTGAILKGIALFLLIIAPLLGEGYLCILMASPLFFGVGALVGVLIDGSRQRRSTTLSCVTLLLVPVCMEGVVPKLTFDRAQSVQASRIVNAPSALVEESLAHSPRLDTPIPFPYRIGFPKPLLAYGDGLGVGATRTIHFAGAEGDPAGDLVMRVAERRPGYARFEAVSDNSKLTQWLEWKNSEVEWRPIGAGRTQVTWRIHFDRQLDPAWYFSPWERVVVGEAARWLIQANATPTEARE
jgi:hypothetical protein